MEHENDLMIVDLACDKPKHVLSDTNINKIHYCRSYLQIPRLSNMCTADGNFIMDTVLKGKWSTNQSASMKDKKYRND